MYSARQTNGARAGRVGIGGIPAMAGDEEVGEIAVAHGPS